MEKNKHFSQFCSKLKTKKIKSFFIDQQTNSKNNDFDQRLFWNKELCDMEMLQIDQNDIELFEKYLKKTQQKYVSVSYESSFFLDVDYWCFQKYFFLKKKFLSSLSSFLLKKK